MACNQDYWNGKTATNSPLSMQLEYVFEKFEEYLSCSKENLTSIFITSMTTKTANLVTAFRHKTYRNVMFRKIYTSDFLELFGEAILLISRFLFLSMH